VDEPVSRLVQKALVAGVPILAAVGAFSSLAAATAERTGMTVIGFLRNSRFNIYSEDRRILKCGTLSMKHHVQ
jgi:FdhD protein